MKKIFGILVLAVLLALPLCVRAEGGVYISQVQITGGPGKTTEDFVELFNPATQPFNLKGHRLVKRSKDAISDVTLKSWTDDIYVPARGFYLWANSGYSAVAAAPDSTTSGSISNDNGVALRMGEEDAGQIVDSVAWGISNNGFVSATEANPEANQSINMVELGDKTLGYQLAVSLPRNTSTSPITVPDNNGEDLEEGGDSTASTTPETLEEEATTTPEQIEITDTITQSVGGGPNYLSKSYFVKIVEIFPNPTDEDESKEQVELLNEGSQAVNLDGWMLDDKNTGLPKSGNYKLSGVIGVNETKSFIIPKGHFVLNNTGGDEVSLYFADKTLAEKVVYKESAPEGLSYQKVEGSWLWQEASLGRVNPKQTQVVEIVEDVPSSFATGTAIILINEITPNPEGQDDGKEWVEFFNPGTNSVDIKNFYLDDGEPGPISENPFQITENFIVPAGEYKVFVLPEGAFALNNAGKENIKLFDFEKRPLQQVGFEDVPEGKSWARDKEGKWALAIPTQGGVNSLDIPVLKLVVSEVLPNPGPDDDEFVEVYNTGETQLDLMGLVVRIGSAKASVKEKLLVQPKSYAVFFEEDLPAKLRNTGQTVTLEDFLGREIAKLEYPKSVAGKSYALGLGEKYVWTSSVTPGSTNEFILGEQTGGVVGKAGTTQSKTAASTRNLEKEISELKESNKVLSGQITLLQNSLDRLALNTQQESASSINNDFKEAESNETPERSHTLAYLGVSAVCLALFGVFARKGLKSML